MSEGGASASGDEFQVYLFPTPLTVLYSSRSCLCGVQGTAVPSIYAAQLLRGEAETRAKEESTTVG